MIIGTIFFIPTNPSDKQNDVIEVNVINLKTNKGYVIVALFKNKKGFPEDTSDAIKVKKIKVKGSNLKISFKDIEHGTYAVSVYQDENNNGKLDTNFFGVPKEGMAVSNNIKASWSAPTFKESKFTFSKKMSLNIKIINL